jgi:2-polyprenyl-3-methyl-5-hydroxy-6-metoxy-1,4-benzoquinol methylase
MATNTASYFDKRSEEWEDLYQNDPRFSRRYQLLTNFIRPLLDRYRIVRALDYGCGTGIFSRWLSSNGVGVIGLDISDQMLQKARDLSDDSITFTNDLSQVTSSRFDAIFALSVLEYVDDVDHLLNAFAAATSSRGLLVASIPNPGGAVRRMESLIFGIRKLTGGRLFAGRGDYLAHQRWTITPKQFDALMKELGYKKCDEMYYNAALDLPKSILPLFEKRWWAALYVGAYQKVR